MAPPWWWCLWDSCVRVNGTFRTIPYFFRAWLHDKVYMYPTIGHKKHQLKAGFAVVTIHIVTTDDRQKEWQRVVSKKETQVPCYRFAVHSDCFCSLQNWSTHKQAEVVPAVARGFVTDTIDALGLEESTASRNFFFSHSHELSWISREFPKVTKPKLWVCTDNRLKDREISPCWAGSPKGSSR